MLRSSYVERPNHAPASYVLNHEMKIAGFVVLAALSGWFVRGMRFDRDPVSAAPAPIPIVHREPLPAAPSVIQRAPLAGSPGHRNLFAYRVHERPVVAATAIVDVPVPVVQAPVIVEEAPAAPLPIPFPHRYIGTFGPARNRVAAFKRDGDIVTVRAGERIGDFTLRSIGLESVEVEGADGVRRIPLTSDL